MARSVIELRGRRFGRLTVVKRHDKNGPRGDPHWVCKCDCGQKTIVSGRNLRFGNTKSCGCLHGPTKRVILPRRERTNNSDYDFDHIEGVKLFNGQMSAEDFKKVQAALSFTNVQMAEEMGISKSLVDDLRSGNRRVQEYMHRHLLLICREYGMVF
jgi:hypothetical protein